MRSVYKFNPIITLVLMSLATLTGCASLHLGVKASHQSDKTVDNKTIAATAFDSVAKENKNLNAQMQQLLLVNVNKNVATISTDEDATNLLQGGSNSIGHSKGGKVSISQAVSIGRTKAFGTYYYANDSIHISLHIGDTLINIHRHVVNTNDLSKISKSSATTNTTNNTTATSIAVHKDSSKTVFDKSHTTQSSTVAVTATASIGGKGYILAVVALIVGLFIGIFIGKRTK